MDISVGVCDCHLYLFFYDVMHIYNVYFFFSVIHLYIYTAWIYQFDPM